MMINFIKNMPLRIRTEAEMSQGGENLFSVNLGSSEPGKTHFSFNFFFPSYSITVFDLIKTE